MFENLFVIISNYTVETMIFILMIFMWYYILDRGCLYFYLLVLPFKSSEKRYKHLFNTILDKSVIKQSPNINNLIPVTGKIKRNLENNMSGIRTVVAIAPMLGLMGTVWGMLISFNVISNSGTGEPGLLAEGISRALSTTRWGLATAVPGLFALGILERMKQKILMSIDVYSLQVCRDISCRD